MRSLHRRNLIFLPIAAYFGGCVSIEDNEIFDDISEIIDWRPQVDGKLVFVRFYNGVKEGSGLFIYDKKSNEPIDGGWVFGKNTVSGRWKRVFRSGLVEEFGAKGDGYSDDTNCFYRCMLSSGGIKLNFPGKEYCVGELRMSPRSRLVGVGGVRSYSGRASGSGDPVIRIAQGAKYIFGGDRSYGFGISGISVVGSNDANVFGGGRLNSLFLDDVSVSGFYVGIGGENYIGNSRVIRCHARKNKFGLHGFVDSHFVACEIHENDVGVFMGSGCNDNSFVSVRNEWNDTNWVFSKSKNNNISGGMTDRAKNKHAFEVSDSSLVITSHLVKRSGRMADSAHFLLRGDVDLRLSNLIMRSGRDDDGLGKFSPEYAFACGSENLSGQVVVDGVAKFAQKVCEKFYE